MPEPEVDATPAPETDALDVPAEPVTATTAEPVTAAAEPVTAAAEPVTSATEPASPGWSALRKTGTLVGVLGIVWFAAKLWAADRELRVSGEDTRAVAQAANSLPAIMQSALLAGLATGLLALVTLERRALVARRGGRLAAAGVAGLVIGGGATAGLYGAFRHMPEVGRVSGAVGLAILVGALLAALPGRVAVPVAAAGGALACFAVGTVLYSTRAVDAMLGWFGGGGKAGPAAQVSANSYVSHIDAAVLGLIAGLVAYWLLRRRDRTAGTFGFLAAGAATGAMLLLAEPFIRIGGAALLHATRLISVADDAVISVLNSSRTIGAMLTLFAGALAAMFAYGRSLPARKARVTPPAPRTGQN